MNEPITITATQEVGKRNRHVVVASRGERQLHRHTFNLNSATARKQFLNGTMAAAFPEAKADDGAAAVRQDLSARLLAFAAAPPGPAEPPAPTCEPVPDDPRAVALDKMNRAVRDAATAFLSAPNPLQAVSQDIEALGVVGEETNRLLVYLVGTSAQLPRPLSAIGRGASSTGKSFLVERVSRLFPPEVVLHATSLTTNALFYFPPGTLRHRWVVAGERSRVEDDDKAEATRALREMIEAGRLSKAVPIKLGDRIVTEVIEQEGPISFVETTTASNVFDEDANRCLVFSTDESAEQTGRILAATAAAAEGSADRDHAAICARHHAIQRMIPRVDVVVPFASAITECYSKGRIEVRREFRHLIQLIKASALLHFVQRERRPDGRVVADLFDYDVAAWAAQGPLGAAACGIGAGARSFLDLLRGRFGCCEFTTTEAQSLGGASKRTISSRLQELNGAGAIEQTVAPRGRIPATWVLTGVDPGAGQGVLPTPEQVREAWSRCGRADKPQVDVA